MASGALPSGVDFNDKTNLDLYFQIRSFKDDLSADELLLQDRSRSDQLNIHTIAQSFDLEYEYSTRTRVVRIGRTESSELPFFVPEATVAYAAEDLPYWGDLHESFDQNFTDFLNFDSGIASREANEEAVSNSQDALADISSPRGLNQKTDVLPSVDVSTLDSNTQTNLAQEIDELLSTTHSVSQEKPESRLPDCMAKEIDELLSTTHHDPYEQQESLFNDYHTAAVSEALLFEGPIPQQLLSPPNPEALTPLENYKIPAAFGRSDSAHSDASGLSGASGRSGRTGPLSDLARAGMKAVKSVGACWRCIFLRKKCDPETPCLICPKGEESNWEALGCHRGDFKTRMLPIRLCPRSQRNHPTLLVEPTLDNPYIFLDCTQRDLWANNDPGVIDTAYSLLRRQRMETARSRFLKEIASKCDLLSKPPDPVMLQPIQHCMICIVWELFPTMQPLRLLGHNGTFDALLRILPAAVVYQATLESDRLIAQSLICLRSCFEVFRFNHSGLTFTDQHIYCSNSGCHVECIKQLHININIYLDELSRVFFKKENLRNKGPSWLSIFYSLCIQSLVRTALLVLSEWNAMNKTTHEQYLYLPLRLFIAAYSGSRDPLLSDDAAETGSSLEYFQQAREATNYTDWNSIGCQSSGEYLKLLFQDTGSSLDSTPTKAENEKAQNIPTMRRTLNLLKCQACRAARKKCDPEDRVWPQKCERCLSHKPEPLECSEPQLNPRKRRPNVTRMANSRRSSLSSCETSEETSRTFGYTGPRSAGVSSRGSCSSLRQEITNWSESDEELDRRKSSELLEYHYA
ncbi:uncharacterized protein PAC_19939 [Phialocephala subalpina]|uniref:Zn(2)-C6 fungal-type domain-containing protein n=1 Tax=Phialocephala subalpina TaxID=576137 RepID=A0A1L7XYD8_9HELO|nr:uncharacterized protein PAC_19939 [Phialocephala subalpina]